MTRAWIFSDREYWIAIVLKTNIAFRTHSAHIFTSNYANQSVIASAHFFLADIQQTLDQKDSSSFFSFQSTFLEELLASED